MEYLKIILLSAVVSYITTKVLAVHYLNMIDEYVQGEMKKIFRFVKEVKLGGHYDDDTII